MADKFNVVTFKISKQHAVKEIEWNEFLDSKTDPDQLFFIQAFSDNRDQFQHWLSDIDAPPLVFERCIDPDANSGVFNYEKMVVLQLPVAANWVSSQHPKLTLICLQNTLIAISENFTLSSACCDTDVFLNHISCQTNISELLLMVLDGLIDHANALTLQARVAVDQLENDLLDGAGKNFETRLLDYKRSIAHFEIALESKHRTLTALQSVNTPLLDLNKISEPLRDVISHIEHSQRYVDRIEDRLSELQAHLILILQGKTNQRLRILTVLSAIFMPLTLIAGIYGMNFNNMPELDWHYGYPLALLAMLGLSIALLIYFARRGWFK